MDSREQIEEGARMALAEIELVRCDVLSPQVLDLATLLCLRDERAMLWALNGTPRVVTVLAEDSLNVKDGAG